jgi:hypothetical protein
MTFLVVETAFNDLAAVTTYLFLGFELGVHVG